MIPEVSIMTYQHFCPECLDIRDFHEIEIEEEFKIKEEKILLTSKYLECIDCAERILDPENEDQNLVKAYNIYRKRKNLLFPEEIIDIREKYGVSQRLLAKILGWSHVTLSRYETGALQSVSHNNELVLIKEPENMLRILERNKENLNEEDYKKVRKKITDIINEKNEVNLFRTIENSFSAPPNEYTGYQAFNLDKLLNIIRYFASKDRNVLKVKLMKYLWYTDFLHFKNWTISLTGLQYAKLPRGPVPIQYDLLIGLVLNESGDIKRDFVDYGYANPGEWFYFDGEFDDSIFTKEELETLEKVYEVVSPHNSTSISEFSHKEKGWLETDDRDIISYEFAQFLNID